MTATSSTSSLWRATLATKRPILPNPYKNNTKLSKSKYIKKIEKKLRSTYESKPIWNLPLIPILIFPEKSKRKTEKKKNTNHKISTQIEENEDEARE